MSRTSFFPAEHGQVGAHTMTPLRFAIQVLYPRPCPLPDGCEPRILPPLGFASSVVLEPAAKFRRRLAFSNLARLCDRAASLVSRELDFGHVAAGLIVVMGLVPFASAGLWASY